MDALRSVAVGKFLQEKSIATFFGLDSDLLILVDGHIPSTNISKSESRPNYNNLVWRVDILGESWPFGTIIADESTRLKSFRLRKGGKRTAALAKIAHKSVHRWVNLTGTPSPNGLMDLWGQAWFVDQGERLGRTHNAFTSRWFNRIQFPGQQWSRFEPLGFAQLQIQLALSDVTLFLNAADWFDIE